MTAAKLDQMFGEIAAETCRTLVVLYYSGHGCLYPSDDTDCAMLSPRDADGKTVIYPLQKSLITLSQRANFYTVGIFENCRDVLSPDKLDMYNIHQPNWFQAFQ